MAAKLGGDDDEAIVDINITPFVDIILVVLIIFMVTATTIIEQSIKVNLPQAATGEPTESSSLAITLDAQNQLFLDGDPITEPKLREFIRAEKAKTPEVVCLIGADHTVSHGRVVALIDLVKSEGVAKFAINIDPTATEDASGETTKPTTAETSVTQ